MGLEEDAVFEELQAGPSTSLITRSMVRVSPAADGRLECVIDASALGVVVRTIRSSPWRVARILALDRRGAFTYQLPVELVHQCNSAKTKRLAAARAWFRVRLVKAASWNFPRGLRLHPVAWDHPCA